MNPIAAEFLHKAEADRATARRELAAVSNPNHDAVCFHAQQCIEKLLKAILLEHATTPPRSHDLTLLASMVRDRGVQHHASDDDLILLQPGAVDYRYPGQSADAADARDAMAAAERAWSALRPALPES